MHEKHAFIYVKNTVFLSLKSHAALLRSDSSHGMIWQTNGKKGKMFYDS